MADNDSTKQEGAENTEQPRPHHTLRDTIEENLQKLNTEFPLSGGETEEDFQKVSHAEGKSEPGEEHHSLLDNILHSVHKLDSEFPLSGGETEEDFESADDKEEGE